ncbi:MAG: zinc metallopeptidase [Bacteroidales bacterium]|nr:zinc metallopeptidase [Bacteroidales bacterium]
MTSGWLLIIVVFVLGLIVQTKLDSVFKKYENEYSPGGLTGKEIAEKMLRDHGIHDVTVTCIEGRLTDHYNPTDKTINLSKGVYSGRSISASAVAAHETGHAVQHAVGYAPVKLRSALVPMVNISSSLSQIVIILGILTINVFPALFWLGIAMFAMVLLFSLVTLPVEYNASQRALVWLENSHTLGSVELDHAKEALTWAARTYLVAALSALATLVYYLGFARRS